MRTLLLLSLAASLGWMALPASAQNIDPASKQALLKALDVERMNEAQYRATIKKFGPVMPYVHIVEAEVQHQKAIESIMAKYGVPIPANTWNRRTFTLPATLAEAARQDAATERVNAEVLRGYVASLRTPEVTNVFARLAQVNLEHHAVAFDRASQGLACDPQGRGSGQGKGRGMGNRQGQGQNRGMGRGQGQCGGVCDGTGPKGKGPGNGARNGQGRGNGPGRNRP